MLHDRPGRGSRPVVRCSRVSPSRPRPSRRPGAACLAGSRRRTIRGPGATTTPRGSSLRSSGPGLGIVWTRQSPGPAALDTDRVAPGHWQFVANTRQLETRPGGTLRRDSDRRRFPVPGSRGRPGLGCGPCRCRPAARGPRLPLQRAAGGARELTARISGRRPVPSLLGPAWPVSARPAGGLFHLKKDHAGYSIKAEDYKTKPLLVSSKENRLLNKFFLYVLEDLHTTQGPGAL
jgi:hypothetical protein